MPDFRGRLDRALEILTAAPPDVMNHNLETVPRLYRESRPGSDYAHSLQLLAEFKRRVPGVPTKSGLMVGLGETDDEILQVMRDLRAHDVDMLTIGQYLAPTTHHLPALPCIPDTFAVSNARRRRWDSACRQRGAGQSRPSRDRQACRGRWKATRLDDGGRWC